MDSRVEMEGETRDALRYYTKTGMSVQVPILYFYPWEEGVYWGGVKVRAGVVVCICDWCRREFPKSMICYEPCLQIDGG